MIRLRDAAVLALTKLRTRKVRTTVTVVTASLLFSSLVLASLVAGGVVDSAKRFTAGSLSERAIVNLQLFPGMSEIYNNPDIQVRAQELQAKVVANKKAAAGRLGIAYDPATEPKPVEGDAGNTYLNTESLAARQAMAEYTARQPTAQDTAKQLATPYQPKAFYSFGASNIDGRLKQMKNGKEDFTEKLDVGMSYGPIQDVTNGWYYLDSSITKPFLVEQKYLDAQTDKTALPIIAPYSKVESALGLAKLSKTATPQQRLDRISDVRARAATVRLAVCYRNSVSQAQVDDAIRAAKEIEQNKDNKEYQKPSLIYGLPDSGACSPAPVKTDTRTASEKTLASKQDQFGREFGQTVDPAQQKVTFRVVGLAPDGFGADGFSSIDALVSMVAGSSLQGMWVVPQDMFDALPNKADYERFLPVKTVDPLSGNGMPPTGQLIEFASAADAKRFVTEQSCSDFDCASKPHITYFGSNSVLIQDIMDSATQALGVAALVIAAIAALILMGMVGRVIGDSRRETAMFRAIGAKRNDIRAIYATYTFFLSLLVALAALAIGVAVALWLDTQFSGEATVRAQLTFVGADGGQQFHLFGLWWQALLAIVGLVLFAGFVSMLLPLSRNLARSPVKDMRDET